MTASPTPPVAALLVFTNWIADAKAANGPEPGYKPAFSGLTGHDVQTAVAVVDLAGAWVIDVSFTSRGAGLLAKLTRDNISACPGDLTTNPSGNCAQRHLTIWLDLTQTDIDNWDDPIYVAKISQPFDFGCLSGVTATTVCPKFVSNPVTLQEIDGGHAAINLGFTEQSAKYLATAINLASHT